MQNVTRLALAMLAIGATTELQAQNRPSGAGGGGYVFVDENRNVSGCYIMRVASTGKAWNVDKINVTSHGRCPSRNHRGKIIAYNQIRLTDGRTCTFDSFGKGKCRRGGASEVLERSEAPISRRSGPNKETLGTVGGVIIGGLIGGALGGRGSGAALGAVGGALVGGFLGNRIGAHLDEQDRLALARLTRQAAASGGPRSYYNRRTGIRATIRPGRSYTSAGQICRTVQQEVVMKDGTLMNDSVKSCKGANGWVV